jgi:glycosyltransferase involved in cell wall biosynthesis
MNSFEAFAINGRFLTQSKTGVQRYASNVSRAIGYEILKRGATISLLAPPNTENPHLEGLLLKKIGKLGGQAWEQCTLPLFWPDQLVNLCNTAPAFKSNQIVCIHDANVFIVPESYSVAFRSYYKSIFPLLARNSTKITTVSAYSADQLAQNLSLSSSEIVVLPNGYEHVLEWKSELAKQAPATLRRYPDGQERPFVLAIGSRARHKNLAMLLGVADRLASLGVDLVIAGGQANIFASEELQRSQNIRYTGFVTDHDLAYLLERALCLAFPSFTEGFGLPALEAMALGCPVISTDRASLPEICGRAALFAPPDEPLRWIDHIQALLENASLGQDLAGKGYSQAKKFSWADTAQGYLSLTRLKIKPKKEISKMPCSSPEVVLIIATLGRPEVVSKTLRRIIDGQTFRASKIIVSCTRPEDVGSALNWPEITVVLGPAGLAAQRNRALDVVPDTAEIIVFFDDDFIPSSDWIKLAVRVFAVEAEIVGVTGQVIADGIKGHGLTFEEADNLIAQIESTTPVALIEPYSPYGCNMAFRNSRIGNLRFDERLVLYGWLEDRDFGAALGKKGGRLVKCMEARGVHLGVKSGRIAGDRLGYSQIINPLYMLRKGTMSLTQVADHLFRNFVSNLIGSIAPRPYIDRRGRLRGNLLGIYQALRGRIEPERALSINRNNP